MVTHKLSQYRSAKQLVDSQLVLLVEGADVDFLVRFQSLFVPVLMAVNYSVHQN